MSVATKTAVASAGVVFMIEGRMDSDTSPYVEIELNSLLKEGHKTFSIDLSDLAFLSSAGLRVFLSLAKKARMAQGEVVFFGLQDSVLEVLQISGFTRILSIHENLDGAQSALAAANH